MFNEARSLLQRGTVVHCSLLNTPMSGCTTPACWLMEQNHLVSESMHGGSLHVECGVVLCMMEQLWSQQCTRMRFGG
jgi:hypothetical protein